MASLKSVRTVLDSKNKKLPSKTTKSSRKYKKTTSKPTIASVEDVSPDSINDTGKTINSNITNRAKVSVTFEKLIANAPIGVRISYVLNTLYIDKKTKQYKHIYSNSAFYKGSLMMKSGANSVLHMMVKSGKTLYYLNSDDIKELYVFHQATPKKPIEISREILRRSKSVEHKKEKTDPKNDASDKLLGGMRPKSMIHL